MAVDAASQARLEMYAAGNISDRWFRSVSGNYEVALTGSGRHDPAKEAAKGWLPRLDSNQ